MEPSMNLIVRSLCIGLLLASSGCSLIVDGRLRERVASCDGERNGTPCLGADYCIADACVFASCGDSVVTRGEQCDDGDADSFDGCTTLCTYTCSDDLDCSDGNVCAGTPTCTNQRTCFLGAPADSGTACVLDVGGTSVQGNCDGSGTCVASDCGNGTVEPESGEECEPTDLGCRSDCQWICESDLECPTTDRCSLPMTCDLASHQCMPGTVPDCDDGDACTLDTCDALVGCLSAPIDQDGDGYTPAPPGSCPNAPGFSGGDCDDANAAFNPGRFDVCDDGLDQDCSGTPDDGAATLTCWRDADGDGFGDPSDAVAAACACPNDYVPATPVGDCFDNDEDVRPPLHPGEERWFAEPYCTTKSTPQLERRCLLVLCEWVWVCSDGSDASFDYDCSGAAEAEYRGAASSCSMGATGCQGSGWTDGEPNCGIEAAFRLCSDSCGSGGLACTCRATNGNIVKRCR